MSLISFLNDLFKQDGFELIDSNSKKYVIGKPIKQNPILTNSNELTKVLKLL